MTEDQKLHNAIREYYFMINDPDARWPEMEFDKNSYMRSAINELELFILEHPEWSVMRSVEEFKGQLANWMCISTNYNENNFICEIAYETICDISDILGGII